MYTYTLLIIIMMMIIIIIIIIIYFDRLFTRLPKAGSKPTVYTFHSFASIVINKLLREKHHCPKREGTLVYKGNRGK